LEELSLIALLKYRSGKKIELYPKSRKKYYRKYERKIIYLFHTVLRTTFLMFGLKLYKIFEKVYIGDQ